MEDTAGVSGVQMAKAPAALGTSASSKLAATWRDSAGERPRVATPVCTGHMLSVGICLWKEGLGICLWKEGPGGGPGIPRAGQRSIVSLSFLCDFNSRICIWKLYRTSRTSLKKYIGFFSFCKIYLFERQN